MISIDRNRVSCPSRLDTSKNNLVESSYQHDDVARALLDIQNSKCCYCEKKLKPLGSTARGIDHFVARTNPRFIDADGTTKWNEANAWENLLYACSTCNRSKGTTPPFDSDGKRNLIDPSHSGIDPEDHVGFIIDGLLLKYKERTGLGKDTIENLKLDERTDYYDGFWIAKLDIDSSFGELVVALVYDDNATAESKRADLTRMSSAHLAHASFRRKYIIQRVDRFNKNELRKINQQFGKKIPAIAIDIAHGHEVI